MTKQEQIEQMAKVIGNTWLVDLEGDTKDVCEVLDEVDIKGISRELYEQGYRKLPKDSVVLKIKEIEDTCNKCHWVTDYKLLKYHEEAVIKLCEQEVKQARKETAKEFAEFLISQMNERDYMGVKYTQGVFSDTDINDFVKQFLGEVVEE